MNRIAIKHSPEFQSKFESYPEVIRMKIEYLRDLIRQTASEEEEIHEMQETLKWGEPSFVVRKGSTIRIDWKPKSPKQYAIYFNCNTPLVETFKFVYGELFTYQKNRAITFQLEDSIPETELKECIRMALTYHRLKGKPFLGK